MQADVVWLAVASVAFCCHSLQIWCLFLTDNIAASTCQPHSCKSMLHFFCVAMAAVAKAVILFGTIASTSEMHACMCRQLQGRVPSSSLPSGCVCSLQITVCLEPSRSKPGWCCFSLPGHLVGQRHSYSRAGKSCLFVVDSCLYHCCGRFEQCLQPLQNSS